MNKASLPQTPGAKKASLESRLRSGWTAFSGETYFDSQYRTNFLLSRLANRLFSPQSKDEWVIKGGSAMWARNSGARATQDIDTYLSSPFSTLEEDIEALKESAQINLDDWLEFEFASQYPLDIPAKPDFSGMRLTFNVRIIGSTEIYGIVKVDLAHSHKTTTNYEVVDPEISFGYLGFPTYTYRLYPLANQIADKICAIAKTDYSEDKPNSRRKDFLDLLDIILNGKNVLTSTDLKYALNEEITSRQMLLSELSVTASWKEKWEDAYAKVLPHLKKQYPQYADFESAVNVVQNFSNYLLQSSSKKRTWSPQSQSWK